MFSSPIVQVALIVAIAGIITTFGGPFVLTKVTAKAKQTERDADAALRHKERLEDWARQDAVAARVAVAATKTQEVATDLLASNTVLDGKLNVIHGLVNSSMTEAMENELRQTDLSIRLLKEVHALHRAAGADPSPVSLAELEASELQAAKLRANLADRLRQQAVANHETERNEQP